MYIAQAFNILHEWWRYLVGVIMVIIAVVIGQIPFTAAVFYKAYLEGMSLLTLDETTMMSLLEPNLNLFLMLLSFAVGLVGLILVCKYLHKQSITHLTTSRPKIDWKRFWFTFFLWGIFSSGLVLIDYFFISKEDYLVNFKLVPFIILFEEYLFRGYLMQGIGVLVKNKWFPLLFTSIVFGLLHIANPEVKQLGYVILVYYIGTGLLLGIMTLMDEGLELALGFHAANNLFTALLVTADWTAFQTHSIFKDIGDPQAMGMEEIFVPVFLIFPILLFILSKKYKWTNWKDKLFGKVHKPVEEFKNLGINDTTLQ